MRIELYIDGFTRTNLYVHDVEEGKKWDLNIFKYFVDGMTETYNNLRKRGYKGEPLEFVQTVFDDNKLIEKNLIDVTLILCLVCSTEKVNSVGLITNKFGILMGIASLFVDGIAPSFEVGDILIYKNGANVPAVMIDKIDNDNLEYTIACTISKSSVKVKFLDAHNNFKRIGKVC